MNRTPNRSIMAAGIAATLALAGCGAEPPSSREPMSLAENFTLASASITLPEERPILPETAAGTLLLQNCTGCHSAEMLTAQPPLNAEKWQAEIDKMRTVFHAPVDRKDDPALLAALAAMPGQRTP